MLKKPLKPNKHQSLLSPKHLTSTAIPEWCALIKGKQSFREAVEAACREAETILRKALELSAKNGG